MSGAGGAYETGDSLESSDDGCYTTQEEDEEENPEESYKILLIEEVGYRKQLWDPTPQDSKSQRDALWLEVVAKLHEKNWKLLNEKERQVRVKRAKTKWKNIRDCYSRDLKLRSRGKGRRYMYSSYLQFLKKVIGKSRRRPTKREICKDKAKRPKRSASEDGRNRSVLAKSKRPRPPAASNPVPPRTREDGPSRQPGKDLAPVQKPSVGTSSPIPLSRDPACYKTETPGTPEVRRAPTGGDTCVECHPHTAASVQTTLLNLLRVAQEREADENWNFAMSLVPDLRELDFDRKIIAKKGILDALQTARYYVLGPNDLPVPAEDAAAAGNRRLRADDEPSSDKMNQEAVFSGDEADSSDSDTKRKDYGPRK